MKNKFITYTPACDVNSVICRINDAALAIKKSDDQSMHVTLPDSGNAQAEAVECELYVNQSKRLRLPFRQKQRIEIAVPEHVVPKIEIFGKKCDVSICGGIYADVSVKCNAGIITLKDAAANEVSINGEEHDVYVNNCTVKNDFVTSVKCGNLLAEETYAGRTECRIKCGNIGLVNLNGKDCLLETEKGNIDASVCGNAQDVSVNLLAKNGTVNMENTVAEGAKRSVRAYTGCGNIVLEFCESVEPERPSDRAEDAENLPPDGEKEN